MKQVTWKTNLTDEINIHPNCKNNVKLKVNIFKNNFNFIFKKKLINFYNQLFFSFITKCHHK